MTRRDAVQRIEELPPGEHPARLAGKCVEQVELGGRKVDHLATPAPLGGVVERDLTDRDELAPRPAASTRRRTARTRATSSGG